MTASSAPSSLRPQHLALLHESGLTDETIAGRGYETAQFKTALTAHGFSAWQAKHTPALLIPIYDVYGALNMYQMRPDTAPVIDGKPLKYMTPKGGALCLDVPRSVQPLLADSSVDLWITEGSKKVDAAVQHGLCCIGALGVTGWMRDGAPLPDWEQIALKGRTVYVAFDADVRRKIAVWRALQALKSFLEGRGARVLIVYLPDDPKDANKKIGLDDYLAAGHGVEALRGLAEETLCPCPALSGRTPRNPLEKLRVEALTSQLRGVADVDPHGGLRYNKETPLEEIGKKARNLSFFYGRIDDIKKWDLIDTWMAASPHIPHAQRQDWKQEHFGRFAPQVGNWVSKVGAFAANKDGRRRPWLPLWLHEMIRDLTPDQQESVFDNFEANGGRMRQTEVLAMIATITGVDPTEKEKEKTPTSSVRPRLDWEDVAQQMESVEDLGGDVAQHILRLVSVYGARYVAQRILDIPIEAPEEEPSAWEGRDVSDFPPDSPSSPNNEPPAVDSSADNADDSPAADEIESSRQTSGRNFTTVKFDAPESAEAEAETALDSGLQSEPEETPAPPLSLFSAPYEEAPSAPPYNKALKFASDLPQSPDVSAASSPLAPLCAFAEMIEWAQRRADRYELPPDDPARRVLDAVHNYRLFADWESPPQGVQELMLSKLAHLQAQWCEARAEREERKQQAQVQRE